MDLRVGDRVKWLGHDITYTIMDIQKGRRDLAEILFEWVENDIKKNTWVNNYDAMISEMELGTIINLGNNIIGPIKHIKKLELQYE